VLVARRRGTASGRGASPAKVVQAQALRRAMTPTEDALWQALRRNALGVRVRSQHVIRGWIVDFYIPSARLIIEVDGGVHTDQVEADARRTTALAEEGLRVLRITNAEIEASLPEVIGKVVAALNAAPP